MVRLKGVLFLCCKDSISSNFNSTMVRLKVPNTELILHNLLFQFHYGTIKRSPLCCSGLLPLNFNSTMVRLKAAPKGCWLNLLIFQFHYGTIKSAIYQANKISKDLFQFHYGTIKRQGRCHCNFHTCISIPLWYD